MRRPEKPAQPLPRGKQRLFLAFTLAFPVLFCICLELALRWFNYGHDLSVFTTQEVRKQAYYLMNPGVKSRYFRNMRFAPATAPDYFPVAKPPGTFRVFCLGGSTTAGYPYYFNGSFSTYLRDRLKTTFPQKEIEVINLGMTATNSFTVLDLARELPAYQPDLLVVYDGHNEFYGALGVASRQSAGQSRWITLLYLRLIHLRTFQLLQDLFDRVSRSVSGGPEPASHGTMMEIMAGEQYVPYGSPTYDAAYRAFLGNLRDLRNICRSAHLPVILATQASNLRDQSPFVSHPSPVTPPEREAARQRLYEAGTRLQAQGNSDSAITLFRAAIAEDSLHASTHYLLAQLLDAGGKKREALAEYVRARDFDELRFRTDSRFNDLIRSMEDGRTCFVADIERDFASTSQDSMIGNALITEHLHPNARGYFLIARSYARVMREHGLLATPPEWASADTITDAALWDKRRVTELDERLASESTRFLTSGWPFTPHPPALGELPLSDTLGQIARRIATLTLDWRKGHEQALAVYLRQGDLSRAEREYKALLSQMPLDLQLYIDLARLYLRARRFDDLKDVMLRSLRVHPTIQAYRTLGDVMMEQQDPAAAARFYEKTDDFSQTPTEKVQNGIALSYAYAAAGQLHKAKTRLTNILTIKPDLQPALQLLAEVNKQLERTPATRE